VHRSTIPACRSTIIARLRPNHHQVTVQPSSPMGKIIPESVKIRLITRTCSYKFVQAIFCAAASTSPDLLRHGLSRSYPSLRSGRCAAVRPYYVRGGNPIHISTPLSDSTATPSMTDTAPPITQPANISLSPQAATPTVPQNRLTKLKKRHSPQ